MSVILKVSKSVRYTIKKSGRNVHLINEFKHLPFPQKIYSFLNVIIFDSIKQSI